MLGRGSNSKILHNYNVLVEIENNWELQIESDTDSELRMKLRFGNSKHPGGKASSKDAADAHQAGLQPRE